MNIYTLVGAGHYHQVNGEDYQYHQYVSKRWFVGAVMDGCSSGKESHFTSVLFAKSIRQTCKLFPQKTWSRSEIEFSDKGSLGTFILNRLLEDIKRTREVLSLGINELLSTIILMVYDLTDNSAWINASGDGIIVCDGMINEIDQNNMPDYLGYHLDREFNEWFSAHTFTNEFQNVGDISISTDGISKLKPNPLITVERLDPVSYFLIEKPGDISQTSLYEKYLKLIAEEKYIPYDDISIIRLIL